VILAQELVANDPSMLGLGDLELKRWISN